MAKLAALYFESRHPSKFMGDISKGNAQNLQKISHIKRNPCLQELNFFFEGLVTSPGALSPSWEKLEHPSVLTTIHGRRTLWSVRVGNYRIWHPL
jgi:hypothetical protein